MQAIVLLVIITVGHLSSCSSSTNASDVSRPLYLLALVPFEDSQNGAGWDHGLAALPGARIARDEVNSVSNLLPGYHIELIERNVEACSVPTSNSALGDTVQYAINQEHVPTVAVIGLLCSTHTVAVSPIAGHLGVDLLQLSAANSPVFTSESNNFPHLWRFLGSGNAYVDTMVSLMDQFEWNQVGVVYGAGSQFFSGISRHFEAAAESHNKTVVFNEAVTAGTINVVVNQVTSRIKRSGATILFVCLDDDETAALLCNAFGKNIHYPTHLWVLVSGFPGRILNSKLCDRETLSKALQGHVILHTQINPRDNSTFIISNETFSTFKLKYDEEILKVQVDYNQETLIKDYQYSSILYDQVWAFTLALNQSLPVLEMRNLSFDSYSIARYDITTSIEKQLKATNFQGASGKIHFNSQRELLSTPIEIFRVRSTIVQLDYVGLYDLGTLNASLDDPPPDLLVSPLLIPLGITVTLYIAAFLVVIFTTLQLMIVLHYRHQPAIKATSPQLSMLVFASNYLICFTGILTVTFSARKFSRFTFTALLISSYLCLMNAICLTLIALFFKLLRLHFIFTLWMIKDLGKFWNACSLVAATLLVTIISNILNIAVLIAHPPAPDSHIIFNTERQIHEEHISSKPSGTLPVYALCTAYVIVFLVMITALLYRNRKIRMRLFKNTKLHMYLTLTASIMITLVCAHVILLEKHKEPEAYVTLSLLFLFQPLITQVVLFTPTVAHIFLQKQCPAACHVLNRVLS